MHGTTMIFLVVMPMLIGFANYLVPLMIGARDMAFPRLNAMSYWLFLFGGFCCYFSFAAGRAPAAGWFSYAPFSEKALLDAQGLDYWALALLGSESALSPPPSISSSPSSTSRAEGLTIRRLPLFVWMVFVNSFLIILALPALNASLVMLLIDRAIERPLLHSPAAARRCCGSTTSGPSAIRRSTSWCCPRSASSRK